MIIFGSYIICGILAFFIMLKSEYNEFGYITREDIGLGIFVVLFGWLGFFTASIFFIVGWWERRPSKPIKKIHCFDWWQKIGEEENND